MRARVEPRRNQFNKQFHIQENKEKTFSVLNLDGILYPKTKTNTHYGAALMVKIAKNEYYEWIKTTTISVPY